MRFAEFRLCFRLNSRCSFEQPQFGLSRFDGQFRETRMKRLIVAALVSLTLVPVGALAQERGGDAALGALSGAVVFGPVGAVAGALVGYTAGPSIARSWGWRGSSRRDSQSRVKTRAAAPSSKPSSRPEWTGASSKPFAAAGPGTGRAAACPGANSPTGPNA